MIVSDYRNDINSVVEWCKTNNLYFNIEKCSSITFSLKNKNIINNYFIDNMLLNRVTEIKDLGIYMDHKLKYDK